MGHALRLPNDAPNTSNSHPILVPTCVADAKDGAASLHGALGMGWVHATSGMAWCGSLPRQDAGATWCSSSSSSGSRSRRSSSGRWRRRSVQGQQAAEGCETEVGGRAGGRQLF